MYSLVLLRTLKWIIFMLFLVFRLHSQKHVLLYKYLRDYSAVSSLFLTSKFQFLLVLYDPSIFGIYATSQTTVLLLLRKKLVFPKVTIMYWETLYCSKLSLFFVLVHSYFRIFSKYLQSCFYIRRHLEDS